MGFGLARTNLAHLRKCYLNGRTGVETEYGTVNDHELFFLLAQGLFYRVFTKDSFMASKQTSIIGPFIVTAIGTITFGLIVLYFGVYQNRIHNYELHIAELQSQPTPEINFSFKISDTAMYGDTSKTNGTSPAEQLSQPAGGQRHQDNSDAVDQTRSEAERPAGTTRTEQPPQRQSAQAGQTASGRPARQSRGTSTSRDEPPVHRGPAFPATRHNQDFDADYDEYDDYYEPDEEPRHIPDINDPELDDNPLIRALREASRRQAENPRDFNRDEPPRNPFEEILNPR